MAVSTDIVSTFNVEKIRKDFPTLHQEVYGKPLIYLDNAATSQKPQSVIDRLSHYYSLENSNVHRGVHHLSQEATDAYEGAREKIRAMLNAEHSHEVIFTKGTTDSINLVAQSFGEAFISSGDEIIITAMEHHANIVPWQLLCKRKGAILKVVPMDDLAVLDMEAYKKLLSTKTKLVAFVHTSNALGTVNPTEEIIQLAHEAGAAVLVDGAQAVPHQAVDVQALDADFFTFSGHKLFGPTGTGVLYGKTKWLEAMPPYQGGGDMIDVVTFEKTTYAGLPHKFEAGTPHIAGFIGLGAAVDYIKNIGYDAIHAWEQELLQYGNEQLATIPGMRFIGQAPDKASVISFLVGDIHPYDAGTILDRLGIAIRTGHHCTQPVMARFGIPGTMRASFSFYNTKAEIDALINGIYKVKEMFG
ncbi:MAG: SufS family cysteine desulfurase [Bacteroidia bacterium]